MRWLKSAGEVNSSWSQESRVKTNSCGLISKSKTISMKKIGRNLLLSGLIVTSVTITPACEKGSMDPTDEQYVSIIEVASDGTTTFNEINLKSTMVETPASE